MRFRLLAFILFVVLIVVFFFLVHVSKEIEKVGQAQSLKIEEEREYAR